MNPIKELAAIAREHGALTIVDTVTSLGGHEVDLGGWGIDVAYSCAQKCIGAPSGVAPIAVSGRGARAAGAVPQLLSRSAAARGLLGQPQVSPHDVHLADLRAARSAADGRGRRARRRAGRGTSGIITRSRPALEAMGLSLLPPQGERLWTLNTVRVPAGVDEAAVRKTLLTTYNIEVGAGPRSAGRQDLARRPDGRQLDAADAAPVPGGARRCARGQRQAGARRVPASQRRLPRFGRCPSAA